MVGTNLKEELFKKLEKIEDDVLIQSVLNFINLENDENSKIIFSEDERVLIDEAKESARKAGVSNAQVFRKAKEGFIRTSMLQ